MGKSLGVFTDLCLRLSFPSIFMTKGLTFATVILQVLLTHASGTTAFQDTAPSTEPLPTSRVSTAQHGIHSLSNAFPSLSNLSQGLSADGVRGIEDEQGSKDGAENTGMSYGSNGQGDTTPPKDDGNIIFPSKHKKDIISQYEARGASPPHGDTGFQVKKTNWQGRLDSPISRFPNEVLIHSLSFLDPQTLLTASLISRRFHSLISSSDAWRSAFSRYFPSTLLDQNASELHESAAFSSSQDRRFFTRLSAGGSGGNLWRKEYILRTRLLRNLAKGKAHISTSHSSSMSKNPQGSVVITYNALTGPMSVSNIAADFSPRGVRLLHASTDTIIVTASDATVGKVERPPLAAAMLGTPTRPDLHQPILGVPGSEVATDMDTVGVMDLSEDVGWIYGENVPNGKCYVHPYSSPYRCASEKGFLLRHDQVASGGLQPAITAVWIAKKRSGGVLETSEGQVGVMIGNSRGFVSIYGLSFGKEYQVTPTKMFCMCPGIPIVSIKVDEDYSVKRKKQNSVWAVIVNALGEIYYLADPKAGWEIIPQTTRIPTTVHSSIFQPPSNTLTEEDMGKNKIKEKDLLLDTEYTRLKQLWKGWGMDWFIELDWAGTNIVLGRKCSANRPSTSNEQTAKLIRYHFLSCTLDAEAEEFVREVITGVSEATGAAATSGSVFGGESQSQPSEQVEAIEILMQPSQLGERPAKWVATDFLFGDENIGLITASAIDISNLTLLTPGEDPGITADVPGGNARLFAVGTNMGDVFVWNVRHQASFTDDDGTPSTSLLPQRVIRTNSPRISTLALSSLYLVHGGNDGLVQAWDLLASTHSPVRSIHSRFSTRARRRLAQADAATLGLGNDALGDNQFAARCLVLDPDPTRLRGAVALGTHIRYWCFSSSSLGPNTPKRSKKSRVGGKVRGTPSSGRDDIKGIIKSDSKNLFKEREREHKEKIELEKRYGISSGRAALNEEEMMEYARMISMEAYEIESGGSIASGDSGNTFTPKDPSRASSHKTSQEFTDAREEVEDLELAQALRLSLEKALVETPAAAGDMLDSENWEDASEYPDREVPLSPVVAGPSYQKRFTPFYTSSSRSPDFSTPRGWPDADGEWPSVSGFTEKGKGKAQRHVSRTEEEELEMAIQLSLMEEEERRGVLNALADDDEQIQVVGKGKGRGW
ncbi:hypothetical protein L873DRAFT_1787684 [Choiromyces venosus 120613-1]|uniref:F-box domain-containing protein n=1 Tax=Choiromyces venosus 120613-1 TaxID=1336337 RepID=A0A3N4JZF1_9PEZI|nr:hypothetical protein L873DRAFT_1787684 [Choiromyces venosus 120613-1]